LSVSFSISAPFYFKVFPFARLSHFAHEIIESFEQKGFIVVGEIPGFKEAYRRYITAAEAFAALSQEEKARCSPDDCFGRGWSNGIEVFNGKRDSYKGSYYAWCPDNPRNPNIWPTSSLPTFEKDYMVVAEIVSRAGKEILSLLGQNFQINCLARMLYYTSVPNGEDDGNPNWCGKHRDHGLFTGLCPEVFFKNGQKAQKPEGSGLHILGLEISPPEDVLLFQIGECLELLSNGKTTATEHWVVKCHQGYERCTMAVFFNGPDEMEVYCSNPKVIEKYGDRFIPGMSYKQWGDRSFAKYNPMKGIKLRDPHSTKE